TSRRRAFTANEQSQTASAQDCELFLFAAHDIHELSGGLEGVLRMTEEISYSELADLSISLAKQAAEQADGRAMRAACIASSPDELTECIRGLLVLCQGKSSQSIDAQQGTFFAAAVEAPRIAFLFPGQASPVYTDGGAWVRRFPSLHDLYGRAGLPRQQSI